MVLLIYASVAMETMHAGLPGVVLVHAWFSKVLSNGAPFTFKTVLICIINEMVILLSTNMESLTFPKQSIHHCLTF